MFLLDTNVVSELRKAPSGRANHAVVRWNLAIDENDLFLSSITIHELEFGILLLSRKNSAGGIALRDWMQQDVLVTYAGRIIPVDALIAQQSAALHLQRTRPWADALIAATALVYELTVVTRNVSDFHATGVRILNPWL